MNIVLVRIFLLLVLSGLLVLVASFGVYAFLIAFIAIALIYRFRLLPAINDITTKESLAFPSGKPERTQSKRVGEIQRAWYPDIKPLAVRKCVVPSADTH
jgi:uncharacterized protein (DUF1499 family)